MPRILMLSVGRRNYLVDEFADVFPGNVLACDSSDDAPAKGCRTDFLTIPKFADSEYIPTIIALSKDFRVDAIISLNDYESVVLAKNADRIASELPRALLLPGRNAAEVGLDKWKTGLTLSKAGVRTPLTLRVNHDCEWKQEASRLVKFLGPSVVLKPRRGSASEGISVCRGAAAVAVDLAARPPTETLLAQTFIEGTEFGADIVNDLSGQYLGAMLREKRLVKWGETQTAVTRQIDSREQDLFYAVARAFGHLFSADIDYIVDGSGLAFVIDVNPRIGGGYAISQAAGASLAHCLRSLLLDEPRDVARASLEYRIDKTFSKTMRVVEV